MQKISLEQHQVLVGILLGDANLQTESQGRTYRLRVTQSEEKKEYLFALYNIFKPFVTTPPRLDSFLDGRTTKTSKRWVFSTTQQRCFRFYGQQFYKSGKKQVPRKIAKWLTPRGLAYWYMDDEKWNGRSQAVRICTDGFSSHEVRRLADVLAEKFTLVTALQKKGDQYRLSISSASYEMLRAIMYHHLLPCMVSKFPRRSTDSIGSN